MGRKIPGKKHHGVKDPLLQRQRRDDALKWKINSAPKKIDDQEIPRKMLEIMEAKAKGKEFYIQEEKRRRAKKKKSIKPKEKDLLDSSRYMGYEMTLPGMKRPLKPIPIFKQRPGESQKKFLGRMEKQVKEVIKRKQYEEKYDVDLIQDPVTGQTKVQNREKDEVEDELEKKRKLKSGTIVKTKEEKRRIKREKEKAKRLKKKGKLGDEEEEEEVKDFSDFQDKVGFNDIVHEPPSLSIFKQKQELENRRRPGMQSDLLLKSKLEPKTKKKKKNPTESLAKRAMMEEERKKIVELYRKLKKEKLKKKA